MTSKKILIAGLIVGSIALCIGQFSPVFSSGASYIAGSLDGLFLLLLVGVAIAGISWRPESSTDAGQG